MALRGAVFRTDWIHGWHECLTQFDARITCQVGLIGLRAAHQGHDGCEGSIANSAALISALPTEPDAPRLAPLPARHELPFRG